jgi:hypothetical protein
MNRGTVSEVVASLEGMRVVVENGQCRLDLYNFVHNRWEEAQVAQWPLSTSVAAVWLAGWNAFSRSEAMRILAS